MSIHCASLEPVRHKTTLNNDRLRNAKIIAENALKVLSTVHLLLLYLSQLKMYVV